MKLKKLFYVLILKPLIRRNLKLRYKSAVLRDGKHPDKWYWADKLSMDWGFYDVKFEEIDYSKVFNPWYKKIISRGMKVFNKIMQNFKLF